MAVKYCFKKSKQCLRNIQLYLECLKKASKQTVNLAAAERCFIRLTAAGCGPGHILLFGLQILVWPTWEADHLITQYKFTFIRKSGLH